MLDKGPQRVISTPDAAPVATSSLDLFRNHVV